FAGGSDSGALDIPERLPIGRAGTDLLVRNRVQVRRRSNPDLDRLRRIELQLTPAPAHRQTVDGEIDQMALAVGDVAAPGAQRVDPALEGQLSVNRRVGPADAHSIVVDAREVGLAADPRPEPDVQRV